MSTTHKEEHDEQNQPDRPPRPSQVKPNGRASHPVNRISLRVQYVGAEPDLRGKIGWTHRPANATGWTFEADDGAQTPCTTQDVTVWLDGSGATNATT